MHWNIASTCGCCLVSTGTPVFQLSSHHFFLVMSPDQSVNVFHPSMSVMDNLENEENLKNWSICSRAESECSCGCSILRLRCHNYAFVMALSSVSVDLAKETAISSCNIRYNRSFLQFYDNDCFVTWQLHDCVLSRSGFSGFSIFTSLSSCASCLSSVS